MKKRIRLEKMGEVGKTIFWDATVEDSTVTYIFGQVDGKLQKEVREYTEGKNIGRANETTPAQQALFEMEVKARKKIENNYKLVIGELTTTSKTVVTSDVTVPKPMLASDAHKHIKKIEGKKFIINFKYDGNRCLANLRTGKIYSRSRKEINGVPHINEAVKIAGKKLKDIEWLDGELYSHELSFNDIQSILRSSNEVHKDSLKIKYFVFDIISNDNNLIRQEMLKTDLIESDYITRAPYEVIDFKELDDAHQKYIELGYEGVIIRLFEGKYEYKRSTSLLKWKVFSDIDVIIKDITFQKNTNDKLGAFVVDYNGLIFNATPAMTDIEKDLIMLNPKKYIGQIAKVRYQNLDEKTGAPRFGVIKDFRIKSDLS